MGLKHDMRRISEVVARECHIPIARLYDGGRYYEFSRPRQLAMYLMAKRTKCTKNAIARHFAKHHTTVLIGIRTVESRKEQTYWRDVIRKIEMELDA